MMSAEQRQKYGAMPPETQNKCYEMLAQEYLRKKIENKGERAAQRRADFLLINKQRMAAQRWDESACRPLQEQISTSNQGERSLSPNKRATSQPPPPQETPAQQAVEINMRLNMDFQAVGQQGSTERQNFTKDLTQDLADASGTGASEFNILKLSPGSVIVDMLAPPKAAQEIQRQSLDPKSRLRNGKVTRFTDTIRLPTVTQQSQPLLPAPLYEIGLKFGDFAPHEVMAVNNVRDEKMRQINNLIQKGDILQHINDTPVQGLNIDELERHILGPKDEMVTLSLFRPSTGQQYQVRVNHHIPIQVKHAGTSPFGTQDKGQTRMKGTEVLLQGEQLSPEEKERMLRLDVDAKHPSPVMTRQKNGNVPECSHCHSPTPVTYLKCGGCRVAAYCSEGCLEVSWKGGHMSRCKQVDQLQGAPIATEGVITSTATKTPPSTPSSTACPPPRTLVLKLKTGADLNQISEAHETNLSGQGSAFESCQSNPSAPMPRVLAVRPPHVSPKTPDTIVSGPRFPADPELEIQRILLETYSSDGESTQKIDGEKRQELFACLKTLLAKSKELSMQGNQTAAEQLVHKVARYGLLLSGQEEKRGGADGGVCSSGGSTRGVRNESEELRGSPGVSTGKTANPKILTLNTCSLAPAPAPASPSPRKIEFSTLQPQLSPHAQAARSKISPHAQAARVFSPSSPAQLSGRTVSSLSPLLSPHEPAARALSPVPVQMQRVQIVGQFRDPP